MSDVTKETLAYIRDEMCPVQTIQPSTREFYSRPVYLPPPDPTPQPVRLSSLGSLVSFLQENVDELVLSQYLLHVVSEDVVKVLGPLEGRHRVRWVLARAAVILPPHVISDVVDNPYWMGLETFNIYLQSAFVETEERAKLLTLARDVKEGQELRTKDDGMSQEITTRAGIETMSAVPNPVKLAPYCTFPEVDQPRRRFIVRMRKDPRGGVLAALIAADGGAWMLDAKEEIAVWLQQELQAAGLDHPKVIW